MVSAQNGLNELVLFEILRLARHWRLREFRGRLAWPGLDILYANRGRRRPGQSTAPIPAPGRYALLRDFDADAVLATTTAYLWARSATATAELGLRADQ